MKARLVITPHLCTGCRTCELACSFTHGRDGKIGQSRIFPLPGGFPDLHVPVNCLQCEDPACVKACLLGAISFNEKTGAYEINQEICIHCLACVAACPFGCSLVDTQLDLVVKCDLCGGDPVCAHFCPSKALTYRQMQSNLTDEK